MLIKYCLVWLFSVAVGLSFGYAQSGPVQMVIDMRSLIRAGQFNPKTDTVGIRGDAPPLSWGRTYPAGDPDHDSLYTVTLTLANSPGSTIFWKLKTERAGQPVQTGWEERPNHKLLVSDTAQTVHCGWNDPPPPPAHTLTGKLVHYSNFTSHYVRPRDIVINLPPGYDSTHERYPVLYLQDGNNLFDEATANNNSEWQVDETAQMLIQSGKIAPLIIVGIYNTPDRMDEYTGQVDTVDLGNGKQRVGGNSAAYSEMLRQELKPYIDQTYRTLPQAATTGIGGSSLGGLLALELGIAHPEAFGRLAVLSPSLQWANGHALQQLGDISQHLPLKIWLMIGSEEGKVQFSSGSFISRMHLLKKTLLIKGWREGFDLGYLELAGGQHNEQAWRQQMQPMLEFLFPVK